MGLCMDTYKPTLSGDKDDEGSSKRLWIKPHMPLLLATRQAASFAFGAARPQNSRKRRRDRRRPCMCCGRSRRVHTDCPLRFRARSPRGPLMWPKPHIPLLLASDRPPVSPSAWARPQNSRKLRRDRAKSASTCRLPCAFQGALSPRPLDVALGAARQLAPPRPRRGRGAIVQLRPPSRTPAKVL